MNKKNVLVIAAMIVAAVFATQMVQQDRLEAQQSNRTQIRQAVEYGRLIFEDDERVTFRVGGVINVRTDTVTATYRRLGGQGRGTFADLLDQLGSAGWNLVQKDGNVWIFSRVAS